MLAGGYVNLMRSVPLVLVIFWFFFLVPYIGAWVTGRDQPIKVGAWLSAVVTFTMFEAAYYCEIMRAGIQSIARGQVWSGYALGLNYWQTMGYIVLPQAFRNMVPVLLTQTIILFQDIAAVRDLGHRLPRRRSKIAASTTAWSRQHLRRGVFHHLLFAVPSRQTASGQDRHHPMISIKNVSKWYGNFQVLADCSTEVAKGEVVVAAPRAAASPPSSASTRSSPSRRAK